jgi:tRNA C32,U32 (ribose-2'-O)-methylase TrmJ
VGNEITGVDPRVMEMADVIAEIPTFGLKNSLNVASAAPIVIFEVLRQWNAIPSSYPTDKPQLSPPQTMITTDTLGTTSSITSSL